MYVCIYIHLYSDVRKYMNTYIPYMFKEMSRHTLAHKAQTNCCLINYS